MQAADPVEPSWWHKVTRYHIPPFYTVPIQDVIADAPETNRDHTWLSAPPSDFDADVQESTSINSSPNKAPHTSRDGVMRTRAGGGAGFEVSTDVCWPRQC